MARDHGRVLVQIWSDPEWIQLTEAAQRAYILALSQPDLSYAGVLATRYKRWSGFAANSSVTKIRRAVRELEDAGFVMVDDDTEEMWIRTFVKHDGILILDQRNYDAILDNSYINEHIFYCGKDVRVEPEYVDEGLARFKYAFPDESVYHLNMFPLRKAYLLNLIQQAGFPHITTYGNFQKDFREDEPEFFVHVALKG